jgi:hypothetical protein
VEREVGGVAYVRHPYIAYLRDVVADAEYARFDLA